MDSTCMETKREQEQFNAQQLLRVEQRRHLTEQQKKEEQVYREKLRSEDYLRIGIIIFVMLLLTGGLLLMYLVLYRKKKTAYRELVKKLQEWAQVKTEIAADTQCDNMLENDIQDSNPADEIDLAVMKKIEFLMAEQKIYTDTELSLESLARELGAKRYYVSTAIHRCTSKSFSVFVNEYRIKEAIRLLSEKESYKFSIDSIAFDAGFNSRTNFYRVFKKLTGISPTEFRNTLVGG